MENNICQSCGMNMIEKEDFGTNKNGSVNHEYCCYCFQKGKFTEECTVEEMIEHNLQFLDQFNKETHSNLSKEDARKEMSEYFPTLKRWK